MQKQAGLLVEMLEQNTSLTETVEKLLRQNTELTQSVRIAGRADRNHDQRAAQPLRPFLKG